MIKLPVETPTATLRYTLAPDAAGVQAMEATFAAYAEKIPAGRAGRAEEVADAIAFVIGNGYMTGHTLLCDGGISLGQAVVAAARDRR